MEEEKEEKKEKEEGEGCKIMYEKKNLFDCKGSSLVHCVSQDLRMGRGIAVEFRNRFGRIDELRRQGPRVGSLVYLSDTTNNYRFVFYLITKEKYNHNPRYEDLYASLCKLKDICDRLEVASLSMPRIGCGLDGLKWECVEEELRRVFLPNSDGAVKTITICDLPD